MALTITISGSDYDLITQYGLDSDDYNDPDFRNERPDGFEVSAGDWFSIIENHQAPDGRTYHVLVTGTHGNDHSPGASHYTSYTLYPADDPEAVAHFARDVAEWEAMPETDPDADWGDEGPDGYDSESDPGGIDPTDIPAPHGWGEIEPCGD